MLIGIDLGYGQVKSSSLDKQYKFLSTVGTPVSDFGRSATVSNMDELLNSLAITYNNTKYYIGYNAVTNTRNGRFSLRQNKAGLEENKIKLLTTLALFTDMNQIDAEFEIVSGLPVLEYKNQKDILFDMIYNHNEPFEFTMHYGNKSVNKNIKINKVKIISQGEASFYDYILDNNGNIDKKKAADVLGRVMVVDPGYKTTDIVTMENGKYIEILSDQLNQGINQVHNECIKLILNKYNIKKEMKEIDNVIRQKTLFYNKQNIDISDIVKEASKPFAEDILDNLINLSNDQLGSLQTLILTGGGGSIIADYIKEELKDTVDVILMKDSEFSNANGYCKYGKLLINNHAL